MHVSCTCQILSRFGIMSVSYNTQFNIFCVFTCRWGAWKEWSAYTRPCDGGRRTCTREVLIEAKYGGKDCVGSSTQTEDCNTSPCPGDWTLWCGALSLVANNTY